MSLAMIPVRCEGAKVLDKMRIFSSVAASTKTAALFIQLWACTSSVVRGSSQTPSPTEVYLKDKVLRDPHAAQACEEFPAWKRSGSGWLSSECTAMWTAWTRTLEDADFVNCGIRKFFNETASRLRQEGNPCVVESTQYKDGAGSASVRYLATWMVAEELGCDWVAPKMSSERIDDEGTLMYCHKTVTVKQLHQTASSEFHGVIDLANFPDRILRCEVVNWLEYFRFREHGVFWKNTGKTKSISLHVEQTENVTEALREYNSYSEDGRPWVNWRFYIGKISANRFVQNIPSWDAFKREKIAGVVKTFRESFHEFPRSWYDHKPTCSYSSDPNVLDIALHVRLGDRVVYFHDDGIGHLGHLEAFMETVRNIVLVHGRETMFHVFSETSLPCPDGNGFFPEFPNWQVPTDQVYECLNANTPGDCAEKRAGAPECNPNRTGVFRVNGKPLYLHVGLDVQNDLSCMIQADGILMGCSTFGQMAGILGRGLKFFSYQCSGAKTPNHYKMMPALAVAEGGHMWVPVSGSWHDPAIMSTSIFKMALGIYLNGKAANYYGQKDNT